MYAYSLVHGTMAANIQGRLCGKTHKLILLGMAAEHWRQSIRLQGS